MRQGDRIHTVDGMTSQDMEGKGWSKGTHPLETLEGGTCQVTKRKQVRGRHPPLEAAVRGTSRDVEGKRPRERHSPTREGEGRSGSESGEKASKGCSLAEVGIIGGTGRKGGSSRTV